MFAVRVQNMTNIHILRIISTIGSQNRDISLIKFLKETADNHTTENNQLVFTYSEHPINQRFALERLGYEYKYTHKQFIQLSLF